MFDALHRELRQHGPNLLDIITMMERDQPEPQALAEAIKAREDWIESWNWAYEIITRNQLQTLGGSVFAVPFLDEGYSRHLANRAEEIGAANGWEVNAAEDAPYQMPELVLQYVEPKLFEELASLLPFMNIWFYLIYQTTPQVVRSIQFAKYEPNGTRHGNWHHDEDSGFTAVVSLAPELFEGGGTDVLVSPLIAHEIPPLPAGHILIFNGKQIRHRGRGVEEGVRHILTFWLDFGSSGCLDIANSP